MMKVKILIFGLIILALIGILFLLVKREGKIKGEESEISSAEFSGAELSLNGFHLVETIGGKPKWELLAKKASVSGAKTSLEEIKCIFFSSKQDNDHILTLEAKRGILDTNTRDIELIGQVKATTNEGTQFTTNTLSWQAKSGVFITHSAVKVIHDQVHISGYGLEIDPEREEVEIKERVKIIIKSS